jgi:hypothetical protein
MEVLLYYAGWLVEIHQTCSVRLSYIPKTSPQACIYTTSCVVDVKRDVWLQSKLRCSHPRDAMLIGPRNHQGVHE